MNSCIFLQDLTGTNEPAYYTHLITLSLILYFSLSAWWYANDRAKPSARIFLAFSLTLGAWLVGSLITWVASDYGTISFFWSLLDFVNVIFFAIGTLFVFKISGLRFNEAGTTFALFVLSIPAFWITGTGQSVTGFYQPACEAYGESWLQGYKFIVEGIYVLCVLAFAKMGFSRAQSRERRAEILLTALPIATFFLIFEATEFYSSTTGVYEVNLYALFAAPILFAPVVYSMLRYQMARFATVGIRLLAIVAVGLVGAQFFFIRTQANYIINSVAFLLVGGFAVAIVKNVRREALLRERAETLSKNLEVANLRLLELDKQKTEFVSLASHQLRGPITAIKGYASMLNEGDYGQLPVAAAEILGRMQKSAHDMAVLIGDYLDVTRIELGKVKYQPERFSVRDLLAEVEKEILPNVPKGKVTLTIDEGADPRFVFADRNKVKQVIGNLLDNAIKYTPEGAVTATLTRRDGYARIEIKDNGVGINKSSLPHLFQKFSRAQNASKTNIKGTGLGLYIAKTIADHHRGHLTVTSGGEGKGSTFVFELPLSDEQAPSPKAA